MKKRLGILMIAFLAVVGFSGAMAAQHVEEGHNNRNSNGPTRSYNKISTNIHDNTRKYRLNRFQNK